MKMEAYCTMHTYIYLTVQCSTCRRLFLKFCPSWKRECQDTSEGIECGDIGAICTHSQHQRNAMILLLIKFQIYTVLQCRVVIILLLTIYQMPIQIYTKTNQMLMEFSFKQSSVRHVFEFVLNLTAEVLSTFKFNLSNFMLKSKLSSEFSTLPKSKCWIALNLFALLACISCRRSRSRFCWAAHRV